MREQWVPMTSIPEVAGWYEISDQGRIRYAVGAPAVVLRGRNVGDEKKLNVCGNGYLYVGMCYGGKQHLYRVHRLVAMEFVPNPNGYGEVNHIDGNKLNNAVSNLEWCDRSANMRHSFDVLGRKAHRWTDEEKAELSRKSKEWHAAHPVEKQTKTYYGRNKEKRKAYEHEYYVAHREEINAKAREKRKQQLEEIRAKDRERYRRKKEAKKVPTA